MDGIVLALDGTGVMFLFAGGIVIVAFIACAVSVHSGPSKPTAAERAAMNRFHAKRQSEEGKGGPG